MKAQSTIECALSLNQQCIILNFADAIYPGGFYDQGATTPQEENVCSLTNLYQTLTQQHILNNYYSKNKQIQDELQYNNCVLTHNYIIRDQNFNVLDNFKPIDIITCAAVNTTNFDESFQSKIFAANNIKIQNIFSLISNYCNENYPVILGAYGCGAFGNDPKVIAQQFKDNLKYLRNKNVYFAIPSKNGNNYRQFDKIFGNK